jgi:hypothetical protein
VTNFLGWYALWPVLLAALVTRENVRVAAILLSCSVLMVYGLHAWIWNWLGVYGPNTVRIIEISSYTITFLPALAALCWPLGLKRVRHGKAHAGELGSTTTAQSDR